MCSWRPSPQFKPPRLPDTLLQPQHIYVHRYAHPRRQRALRPAPFSGEPRLPRWVAVGKCAHRAGAEQSRSAADCRGPGPHGAMRARRSTAMGTAGPPSAPSPSGPGPLRQWPADSDRGHSSRWTPGHRTAACSHSPARWTARGPGHSDLGRKGKRPLAANGRVSL